MPSTITIPVLSCAPLMNGRVMTDPAWLSATRMSIGPSGASYFVVGHFPDVSGQDYLYFGAYINDFLPSSTTRLILGFVTQWDNSGTIPPPPVACAWKTHYWPIPPSVPAGQNTLQYWRNCPPWGGGGVGGWNQPGGYTELPPAGSINAWLQSNTCSWHPPSSTVWCFETKIPFNPSGDYSDDGIYFPASPTQFFMYVNVLSSPNGGGVGNIQAPWPSDGRIIGPIDTNTPDVQTYWGLASLA